MHIQQNENAARLHLDRHQAHWRARSQEKKPLGAHLAKTALAEHHQEVEVSQLHAILVAVGVEPGRSVGRLAVGVLAWADLRSLDRK